MKYKAIISDIDGTLTDIKRDALPSDKVTQSIKHASNKIIFCLATGRPFQFVTYLTDYLQLQSPIISDNGAVITDSKTKVVLWEAPLAHEEAKEVLKITNHYDLTRASCDTANLENPKVISENMKIRKISVHGLIPKEAEKLVKLLEEQFKDLAIVKAAAFEGKEFMDVYISNAEATKQHAVLKLAEILQIQTHEIIGIGDHYNDFPLLMACGLKVAMGNAVPELKAIADYIAPDVDHDGVADVIEKFVLNS